MLDFAASLTIAAIILFTTQNSSLAAKSKMTPEAESLFLARHIHAISDEKWATITGTRASEKYTVIKGDTLSDISKRMFGDSKYWPKVWALNNGSITNPHRIHIGSSISFMPGSGNSLPSVKVAENSDTSPHNPLQDPSIATDGPSARSNEWKYLPKQSWESFAIETPPEVDPLGFDMHSKVVFAAPTGFEPQAIPTAEKMSYLGQIVGSRSESQYLTLHDTVYIRADAPIQIGETYAITQEPTLLKSPKSDRAGYSYIIAGKVKILAVRDHLYIGILLSVRNFLPRGSSLIPLPAKIPVLTPIPGPRSIQGILMVDHNFSTFAVAQHKEVYIDRGSDDGVKPGMIFRVYEHFDPSNDKKITNSDFIIDADIQVTQVTPTISSGIVIQNKSMTFENASVVLLTDISDLIKNPGFREKDDRPNEPNELNELDKLDTENSIGKDDKKELQQLEKWKSNPPTGEPSPEPSSDSPPVPSPEPSLEPPPLPSPEPTLEPLPLPNPEASQNTPSLPSPTDTAPTPDAVPPPPPEPEPNLPDAPPPQPEAPPSN